MRRHLKSARQNRQNFKWMFIENQHTPTVVSIPFPVTCHPFCQKRTVVNTLLRRPNNIPPTNKGRREEMQRVKAVLRDNNYPMSFVQNWERALTKQPAENNFNCFETLP